MNNEFNNKAIFKNIVGNQKSKFMKNNIKNLINNNNLHTLTSISNINANTQNYNQSIINQNNENILDIKLEKNRKKLQSHEEEKKEVLENYNDDYVNTYIDNSIYISKKYNDILKKNTEDTTKLLNKSNNQ